MKRKLLIEYYRPRLMTNDTQVSSTNDDGWRNHAACNCITATADGHDIQDHSHNLHLIFLPLYPAFAAPEC